MVDRQRLLTAIVLQGNKMATRLIAVLVVAAAASVLAQPKGEPTEAELEALVRQSPKEHYARLIKFNEQKLERIFQAQLAKAGPELKTALERSQKAWREFYDAECLVGEIRNREGSDAYPATAGRRIHLLHARMEQLAIPFLQGWTGIQRVPDTKN
jgi:uncharacterized protein YecT (DUF1311 family)